LISLPDCPVHTAGAALVPAVFFLAGLKIHLAGGAVIC
jgi:hypothetical protein